MGDLSFEVNGYCSKNLLVVRCIYGALVVLWVTVALRALRTVLLYVRLRPRAKDLNLLMNCAALVTGLQFIACGLLKVSDQQRFLLGLSAPYTVLFCGGMFCTWISLLVAAESYAMYLGRASVEVSSREIRADSAGPGRTQELVNFIRLVRKRGWIMIATACYAPCFALLDPGDPALGRAAARFHYWAIFTCMLVALPFGILPVIMKVYKDIETQTKSLRTLAPNAVATPQAKKIEKLLENTLWLAGQAKSQTASNMLTCAIFGAVPFLTDNATYQLGFAWTAISLAAHGLIEIFKFPDAKASVFTKKVLSTTGSRVGVMKGDRGSVQPRSIVISSSVSPDNVTPMRTFQPARDLCAPLDSDGQHSARLTATRLPVLMTGSRAEQSRAEQRER